MDVITQMCQERDRAREEAGELEDLIREQSGIRAAAKAAAPAWAALPFDERAAVFLRAADLPARPGTAARVSFVVTGGPDGDVAWRLAVVDGRAVDAGRLEPAVGDEATGAAGAQGGAPRAASGPVVAAVG